MDFVETSEKPSGVDRNHLHPIRYDWDSYIWVGSHFQLKQTDIFDSRKDYSVLNFQATAAEHLKK
jgi:hypothetical protein